MEPDTQPRSATLTVPLAIVLAGVLIAGAIFLSRGGTSTSPFAKNDEPATPSAYQNVPITIRALNETTDHLRGNPDAVVVLFEYSDTECPFCKTFQGTLQKLMDEYGKAGTLAWVYRNFPLAQLHPKAPKEAEAIECAAEQGGNSKFWEYLDKIFEVTPSNNGLDQNELPKIAEQIGLNRAQFETCLSSGKQANRVQTDYAEATKAGGNGTPFNILATKKPLSHDTEAALLKLNASLLNQMRPGTPDPIVISADKQKVVIGGAFPYPTMKQVLDMFLK